MENNFKYLVLKNSVLSTKFQYCYKNFMIIPMWIKERQYAYKLKYHIINYEHNATSKRLKIELIIACSTRL